LTTHISGYNGYFMTFIRSLLGVLMVSVALCGPGPVYAANPSQVSISASPASVLAGQTEQMTATASVGAGSFYIMTIAVTQNGEQVTRGSFRGLSLIDSVTNTYSWTVPTMATLGTYTVTVKVGTGSLPFSASATTTFAVVGSTAVDGRCGASNGADLTSAPTSDLCSTGMASSVTGSGPFDWTCAGSNGGSTASCSAFLTTNGSCGPANGSDVTSAPTSGLCSVGLATTVSGTGPFSWSCAGSNGGSTASCSAALASGRLPSGVTLSPIDGETLTGDTNTLSYFSGQNADGVQFNSNSGWLNNQILIGVWEEQPQSATQVGYDVAMGNNLYVHLGGTPGGGASGGYTVDYNVIRAGGMHVIAPTHDSNTGSETVGYLGTDEPDLNWGQGSGPWALGKGCTTTTYCGYTAVQYLYTGSAPGGSGTLPYPIDGRVIWDGDGKSVLQFESGPGSGFTQAAPFLKYSDINAADNYWLTDPNDTGSFWGACQAFWNNPSAPPCANGSGPGLTSAQAALPANYETNVTLLRHIQQVNNLGSKPIFGIVETGCPFSNGNCVTSAQFTAAAWHELIAGARGIVWFQHNFSGPCVDFVTFYDGSNPSSSKYNCVITGNETLATLVQAVKNVDSQINALSSVLLSPSAEGYVTATGTVSTMAKFYNGNFYIFAGSGQPGTPPSANQSVTFSIAGAPTTTATVVYEGRTINVVNGQFSDTFADANAVHIYQIP
jgi:hypothetical protein